MRTSGVVLLSLSAGYLGICWYVATLTVTPIRMSLSREPADFGFAGVRPISLMTEDAVRLQGWLAPSSGERAIVLVHGINSHAWDGQAPDVARAYVDAGFSVLLFDLRAHGRSDGTRLGLGWHERCDVRAAVALLTAQGFQPGRIGLHGVSYGAATALLAAAEIDAVGAVVADTAFANIRDVVAGEIGRQTGLSTAFAQMLQPGLRLIAWRRFGLDFNGVSPEEAIAAVAPRPILLIHGSDDAVTPVESATRLRAAAARRPNSGSCRDVGTPKGCDSHPITRGHRHCARPICDGLRSFSCVPSERDSRRIPKRH